MSKHHRASEHRTCVGGRWAGDAETHPCVIRFQHKPDCDDRDQCPGCLPREAVEGWLCETCDRYLRQWLGDGAVSSLPWVYDWLGREVGTLRSTAIRDDWQRPSDKDSLPSVIGDRGHDLIDCRQLMADRVYIAEERVRQSLGQHLGDAGPWSFADGVAFLRRHTIKIEDNPMLVGELYRKVQDSMVEAHALAPWRKTATTVRGQDGPIACPHCERKTLRRFGGDDFVTCVTCHATVHEKRFGIWTEMLEQEREA